MDGKLPRAAVPPEGKQSIVYVWVPGWGGGGDGERGQIPCGIFTHGERGRGKLPWGQDKPVSLFILSPLGYFVLGDKIP